MHNDSSHADRRPSGLRTLSGAGLAALSLAAAGGARAAEAAAQTAATDLAPIIVTARQRPEDVRTVPASVEAFNRETLRQSWSDNIAQTTLIAPSLNYASPNPRNTSLTLRGLGSSVVAIAQANDGLEPGVGVYVDGVYHGRPATAAFDFNDVDQIEVLRGPQGTVFGKNTTAGALNIKTAAPEFAYHGEIEGGYGTQDWRQVKATVTGPLGGVIAARISVVATARDGVIHNVATGSQDNRLGSYGVRGQLLFKPNDSFSLRLIGDAARIDEICCTQVYVRVGTSLKPAARQFPALAAGQTYAPPSTNPYDRLTDIDAALGVHTGEGGASATATWNLGPATLTSISAWRYWDWDAANDRDYTGLSIQTLQHIPSRQDQYSQELRLASNGQHRVDYVAGLYFFDQDITGEPITQYGPLATYWLFGTQFPGDLLSGYGTDGHTFFHSASYAAYGEATWHVTSRLRATGGLRYTYEQKHGSYASTVYGGATPANSAQLNAQLSILRPQSYTAAVSDGGVSGRVQLAYDLTSDIMAYASWADVSKSGGINMSGLPLNAQNLPALNTAVIRPEHDTTLEAGLKTQWLGGRLRLDVDGFKTIARQFQTNVVDNSPGALRGYLANIPKVRVQGVEADGSLRLTADFSARAALTYTDGKYVSYANGPCPLELIASSTTACDLSGRPLPYLPKWSWSMGGEYSRGFQALDLSGRLFLDLDLVSRSSVYGDPSDSKYTLIDGYQSLDGAVGFRSDRGWELAVRGRNLTGTNYLQNLTVQAGNSGLIVGTPSDPRLIVVMLKLKY